MSETAALVDALKRVLRSQKITYADLARQLDLSESSMKRCFAQHQFTLDRFEQICQIAGVQMAELAALAAGHRDAVTQLTEEQEEELVRDEKLLLVTMLVLNHWSSAEIMEYYAVTEQELLRRLLKLDQLKMIELLPGDRIRPKVSRHFAWRPDGPVQAYYAQFMRDDFMRSDFSEAHCHKRFLGALISPQSMALMHRAIDQLAVKLDELIQADTSLPLEEKLGVAAVFAIRPWEVPSFRAMRRFPERHSC
ncbi:helix-turn-helix domain-containing protein [Acanthopleuribacter pedis]|uniref:Helix-turn-helix transcriptional regulator n=1 Tax=Acanthopleuribacter pedis TaxID=442870 RepID=A0A8J7QMI3_9BACT|nr:helix-turn-helix transcriptional regulator [Acanthopleuribacter pedis]MBO1320725.1 helix-turn-helix transcriptional regulator [Acanthopleuribacter pedis]